MSQWIERSGGTISIPETGFTMTFPEGAVTTRIRITVTADEKYVAYKMEPAGTQFSKEVPLSQSLAATELTGHALRRRLFAVLASG